MTPEEERKVLAAADAVKNYWRGTIVGLALFYDLDRILTNLMATIPAPYIPPPKPQASWATLKPGDRLRSTKGVDNYRAGTLFVILSCDSAGIDLSPTARWTDREWKEAFVKERKPRVARKKKGKA